MIQVSQFARNSHLCHEVTYSHNHSKSKSRVAGLGRLSAGAKMALKPFVKRVFTIFATNASFLHVIANLQI